MNVNQKFPSQEAFSKRRKNGHKREGISKAKWYDAFLKEQREQTRLLGKINSVVQAVGIIFLIAVAISVCNAIMSFGY